ncbi:MAG: EfeM/EfeO family lipoprotein [Deltaproteobacteria bacterium]|nr:EfeM/EfeO family lipoprotein [Deltaproteobacteria bacterium]
MWNPFSRTLCCFACFAALAGCKRQEDKHSAFHAQATTRLKQHLAATVNDWVAASVALHDAAPVGNEHGWAGEGDALARMKKAWTEARRAYELVEGALAPLFPESDVATDSRYEDFLVRSGGAIDSNMFDDVGVVGMHAIERILWADAIAPSVLAYEQTLPGFVKAAQPATMQEAADFKAKLVAKLVADTQALRTQLQPLQPDIAFVYRGLLDLVREQVEKVDKMASGEEESRYAQTTMADLSANLEGTWAAYNILAPWLRDEDPASHAQITEAFAALQSTYAEYKTMPMPPPGWSSLDPSAAALATPFGKLFSTTRQAADPKAPGSLVALLRAAAPKLGLPEMP